MLVFLVLSILYPNGTLAEGLEDWSSCKAVLEAKRSSESEYFFAESIYIF